ncbi:MAG TPA: hypothetical protein VK762_38150 [Polyangiaceae bacterium]|jgi:hypothetical protein|nr:hypothetical protein [Polyangiaceae bacterium]
MRPPAFDPRSLAADGYAAVARWAPRFGAAVAGGLRAALRWGAHHTGLPVIVVAAVALVLSWRLLRRTLRLSVEVVVAVALLVVATRLGWLTW